MKNKKWFALLAGIMLLATGFYLSMVVIDPIPLKAEELTKEYGEELTLDAKALLATNDSKVLGNAVIDLSEIEFESGEDYPEVGEYIIYVTYSGLVKVHSKSVRLFVVDSTAPIFVEAPEQIMIRTKDSNHNFKVYFEVEDLSPFKVDIDISAVNFEEVGTYGAQAVASDMYENKLEHDFYVVVQEEQKEVEESERTAEDSEEASESTDSDTQVADESEEVAETDDSTTEVSEEEAEEVADEITPRIKNGILIVNKKNPLPADHNPGENPTAVNQLQKLIAEMQNQGYDISNSYSGFRTYEYQKSLYERYMSVDGQAAADTYSARPGYSEHQTGLTFDLKHNDGTLVEKEAEAKWIAENAADYGFIVRYQAGKEEITGYQAEPWHLRYIGDEATAIYNSGLTLEEYLGVQGGDYDDN